MRHRTGLRNRWRDEKSTYSRKRKGLARDSYGTFQAGRRVTADIIAGRTLTYTPGKEGYQVVTPAVTKRSASTPYSRTHKTLTVAKGSITC